MQTQLSPSYRDRPEAQEAASLIRKCVHCGFCNATCPTYQVLGNELDGPRGRIYLIKQMLEEGEVSRSTQEHLDRCLTCLNCETTCPSGVQYGSLVEIGRALVDERVERPAKERAQRWLLREGLTSKLFAPALSVGRMLRPLLPAVLRDKIPTRSRTGAVPTATPRPVKAVMLSGCVQPAMLPDIDRAAVRVLAASGIEVVFAEGTACCGALRTHLSDQRGGLDNMRRNVDAWTQYLTEGVTFLSSASACALTIKSYGHALRDDPAYATRAVQIAERAQDLSELLPQVVHALKGKLKIGADRRIVFHPPCTLQHGQKLRGGIVSHLRELGFDVTTPANESHLCCGSAGAYSVLQPEIAGELRTRKLENIAAMQPDVIASANVGCIQHLQAGTPLPVRHWIELIDEVM